MMQNGQDKQTDRCTDIQTLLYRNAPNISWGREGTRRKNDKVTTFCNIFLNQIKSLNLFTITFAYIFATCVICAKTGMTRQKRTRTTVESLPVWMTEGWLIAAELCLRWQKTWGEVTTRLGELYYLFAEKRSTRNLYFLRTLQSLCTH